MNRIHEFRRLRWLLQVQDIIQKEKTQLMSERLMQLNIDETALEFNRNELARLLEVEQKITTLSYTYDFDREPSIEEISKYVSDMAGFKY